GFQGCQMPEQLLGRIIRSCSDPGDLVLDPFSGSATTLVVAKKLGRNGLGFDLSADYVRRGKSRLDKAHVGAALVGAPEPLVSAPATPVENLNGKAGPGNYKKARQVKQPGKTHPSPRVASARRTTSPSATVASRSKSEQPRSESEPKSAIVPS